jgi:ParB family chromosome partitioning protein
MKATIESIKAYGVLVPAIVRPRKEGGYEIIAGHRRKYACEQAGLETMPVIVRDLDDDEATIIMVDSNLQRENILPSERAQAYKMKMEAIKRQGERNDLTSCQVGTKFRSDQKLAEDTSESARTIQRYIRLTELIPPLQELVDDKKIGLTPASEISFLKPKEQELLLTTIESEQAIPSLSQAQRLKKLSQEGKLNEDNMLDIMSETKKDVERVTLTGEVLRKYFPRSYSPKQIEDTIMRLIETWYRKRQQEHSR